MENNHLKTGFFLFLLVLLGGSCSQPDVKTSPTIAPVVAPDLNAVNPVLPNAAGYQTYLTNCLTCHSSMYVLNQPDLPEKTWAAIVTKMQKTFGAPVADSSAREIVQYLVAIKGKS